MKTHERKRLCINFTLLFFLFLGFAWKTPLITYFVKRSHGAREGCCLFWLLFVRPGGIVWYNRAQWLLARPGVKYLSGETAHQGQTKASKVFKSSGKVWIFLGGTCLLKLNLFHMFGKVNWKTTNWKTYLVTDWVVKFWGKRPFHSSVATQTEPWRTLSTTELRQCYQPKVFFKKSVNPL